MTREQIEKMVKELIGAVDYDIAKQLDPETAEEPEFAEVLMDRCVSVVEKHMKNN